MTATILRAGFLTTVQDLGRNGYRASGVSVGGALDPHALRIANLLVGNDAHAAGLEVNLGQVRMRFSDDRLVAWCGGACEVRSNEATIPPGRPALIRGGEDVRIAAPDRGTRGWVAISGGIDVPIVLGSRSTDLRSGFGGLNGRALRDGDVLKLGAPSACSAQIVERLPASRVGSWSAPYEWTSPATSHGILRVVDALAALLGPIFTVSPDSDRMGIRLQGAPLMRERQADLLSEAVAPGTIQLPPSGQPILLLGDCQTIGGYPKIAHVITIDLPAAVQLRAGDPVRFAEITLAEAQRLLIAREREVACFRVGLALRAS